MYVCICRGITDSRIRQEVANGATTIRELGARLGVATHCGQCGPHARAVLAEAVQEIVTSDVTGGTSVWEPAA